MSSNDRFRLHDEERLLPSGPQATQHDPEDPICCGEARPAMPLSQHRKLPRKARFSRRRALRERRRPVANVTRCDSVRNIPHSRIGMKVLNVCSNWGIPQKFTVLARLSSFERSIFPDRNVHQLKCPTPDISAIEIKARTALFRPWNPSHVLHTLTHGAGARRSPAVSD